MNLLQLALAAEELTHQNPGLQVEPARCVRSLNQHATCEICVTTCPTGAITLDGNHPTVDMDSCIKCGLCQHACPTGAFESSNHTYHLLNCITRIPDHEIVDVMCAHHRQPDKAARDSDAIIQINGCLAGLAPSAYVGMVTTGVQQIRVRLDACADCPLRILQPHIEHTLTNAATILMAFDHPDRIQMVTEDAPHWRQRPHHHAKNPPLSRRGFFSMLAPDTTSAAAEIAPQVEPPPTTEKHPPLERRRLLRALGRLEARPPDPETRLNAAGFATFTVADGCTACEVCARVCPTAALQVEKTPPTFSVIFSTRLCTDCGLCVDLCEPGVLHRAQPPLAAALQTDQAEALHTGSLQQCPRCKSWFSGDGSSKFCPVCDFRRQNPLGAKLPNALLDTLPGKTRDRLRRLNQDTTDNSQT